MDFSILSALVPIFVIILIGYGLARADFPGSDFWVHAERLTYYLLFPALLLRSAAVADFGDQIAGQIIPPLIFAVLLMSFLLLILRPKLAVDGPGFTSVFQGGIRFNTYIGLAAAFALYGAAGLAVSAVIIAVLIPLVNLLSVLVLVRYARPSEVHWGRTLLNLFSNPLILACLGGILLNLTDLGLPWGSSQVLEILGRASLPLGLLAVGAGLSVKSMRSTKIVLTASAILKLIVFPVLMFGACRLVGVEGMSLSLLVMFAALPGSASSYILARQLGGDANLMASILTLQTAAASVSLPLVLLGLEALG